jgi:hypothetical protein
MQNETLITNIAEYLDGLLREGLDARQYAQSLVETSDFSLAFDGVMQFEVRGADTASGNPLPFRI